MGSRYLKRKREQEISTAAAKAAKTMKAKADQSDREMVFGNVMKQERTPLSPRVTVPVDRNTRDGDSGMGVKDEAMGFVSGGKGLTEVGKEMIDEDDD